MHTSFTRWYGIVTVLACCFLFSSFAFSQSAPFGYLDSAADSKGNTSLPATSTLIVSGWAGDNEDFAPVAKVQVFIDGKLVANATLGQPRPDVATAFGTNFLTSGWTASVSLATFSPGAHTVTAVATDSTNLTATLTNQKTITIIAADLTVSGVSFAGTPAAGAVIQVTDTTTNIGQLAASTWSITRFYLNTQATKGGTIFGSHQAPALPAGLASGPVTTNATLPAGVLGQYYVVVCANDTNTVAESAANNCASTPITITGPDLVESITAPATANAGGTVVVSDTLTNQGGGAAAGSVTRFYLNTTAIKGGTLLGNHYANGVAANTSAAAVNTTLTLPGGLAGSYFVLACANDTNIISETNPNNNCGAAPITISGADLTTSLNSVPNTAFAGSPIQITDTTSDIGAGAASWSITRFYLNTSPVKGGTQLGIRNVPALNAGTASGPVTSSFTVPSSLSGAYYVVACANDTSTVVENTTSNNCAAAPVNLYLASKTIIVDPTRVATPYDAATCGKSTTATCKTIADGLSIATAGQSVLVYPGTYTEQLTISKAVTLVSAVKNAAVVQASTAVKLAPDADNLQVLVTITGGVSATVKDMTIAGPIFADSCADNIYGVFVKNANVIITGNTISAIQQSDPGLWGCQPGVAIRFGSRALNFVGHTGTISNNVITSPAKAGIVVDGDNTNVSVTSNTITGLNVVNVVGQNGIQISRGALATVTGNTVSGFRYGDTLMNLSAAGILLYDIKGGVQLTNNTVSGNDEGIAVYHSPQMLADGSGPDYNVQFTTGAVIKNNNASNNVYLGIHIDPFSKGNTIWNNTARGNLLGWDELDEHPDFNSNNWGTDPSQYNTVDSVHAGQVFSY